MGDKQNVEMLILLNVTKDVNQKENHNQEEENQEFQKENHNQKRLENVNVEHLQSKNVDQEEQTDKQDAEMLTLHNVTKDVNQKENQEFQEENQFQKENQEFQEENHNQKRLENVNVEHLQFKKMWIKRNIKTNKM